MNMGRWLLSWLLLASGIGASALIERRALLRAEIRGLCAGVLVFGSIAGAAFGGFILWPAALAAVASLATNVLASGDPSVRR